MQAPRARTTAIVRTRRTPGACALLALLPLASPLAQDGARDGTEATGAADASATPAEIDRIVLPLGELADRVARLEAATVTLPPPPAPWPAWSDRGPSGWGGEAPWRRWVELLRDEAAFDAQGAQDAQGAHDAARASAHVERRAGLALLAAAQGRSIDAWRHLDAVGEDPMLLTILPALLPGLPHALLGTADAALDAGGLLTPSLPPPRPGRDGMGAIAGLAMEHREVRVGDSVLAIRVLLEGDGVQVDLFHRSGPSVEVRVLPPVPPGVEIGLLYANWYKIAKERQVVPLVVTPDEERQTIWGRFRSLEDRWPSAASSISASTEAAPLYVVVPESELSSAVLARFSEALAALFDRPCSLLAAGTRAPDELFEPLAIHLGSNDDGGADEAERKLLGLLSMIEQQALVRE